MTKVADATGVLVIEREMPIHRRRSGGLSPRAS
jgi:hypothetical protein